MAINETEEQSMTSVMEITATQQNKEKRMERNENSLRDL